MKIGSFPILTATLFFLTRFSLGSQSMAWREQVIRPGNVIFIQVIAAGSKTLDVDRDCRVSKSGEVDWLLFGRVKVSGLTCGAAATELNSKVSLYVKQPKVIVRILKESDTTRITGNCERHRINPGDILSVRSSRSLESPEDITGDFTVDESGKVDIRKFGKMMVRGKNVDQIEEQLQRRLRRSRSSANVWITVSVPPSK